MRVIGLAVQDCRAVFSRALQHGATVVREPSEERDQFGHVITAEIATFGDVIHRFVERKDYTGTFSELCQQCPGSMRITKYGIDVAV